MDEEKEYDIDDEQEENSDGYYDMSDDYDDNYNYNDYSYSSSQPNRFINNFKNKQNKNDESNLAEAKENGAKKNSQTSNNKCEKNQKGNKQQENKTDDTLKKNIRKQAGEKPKESNIAKGGPSGSSGGSGADMAKKMAADKAKNTMNSIHDNNKANESNSEKKSDSDKSEDGEKKDEKGAVASKIEQAKQAGQQAGKEILSKAITAETGIPKPIADKIAEKAMNKQMKKQKIQMYAIIAVMFLAFCLIAGIVFGSDEGDEEGTIQQNNNLSKFYSSNMSDEELYKYFSDNGYIDYGICIDSKGNYESDCPFMSFLNKIKSSTDNENQFIYIFYAISYNRTYYEYINESDELDDLLKNKSSLSTYLNGTYLTTYRKDLSKNFDLYGYVSGRASTGKTTTTKGYSVCDTITVDGVERDNSTVNGVIVDFEEYVAGVIKHEMAFSANSEYNGKYNEAIKALAIAARTYAYRVTDGCQKPISNSTGQQTYYDIDKNDERDKRIVELVNETSGILLKDTTGDLIVTQYDSFCFTNKDNERKIYHLYQGNIDIPFSWTEKMNIEGMGTTEYKTRDGKIHTSGWVRLNCPCNNSQHGNNVDIYNKECSIINNGVIEYLDGGHGNGMSQYGALYLNEEEGLTYDQILKKFYGDDIVFEKSSAEFEVDSETGFKIRNSRAQRDNKFFYGTGQIEGECVWYVYGRANEILSDWGSKNKWSFSDNAGQLCFQNYVKRNSSQIIDDASIEKIQQGDVLSWYYSPYGHVAIVEKVERDSSGKVSSVWISEGGLGYYTKSSYNTGLVTTTVIYDGKTYEIGGTGSEQARNFVNAINSWPSNQPRRQALCESHGTGCQNYEQLSRDLIKKINKDVSKSCIVALSAYK